MGEWNSKSREYLARLCNAQVIPIAPSKFGFWQREIPSFETRTVYTARVSKFGFWQRKSSRG